MNPDNDSSNTGESQYPSGGSQFGGGFPSGGGGNQFPVGYPPFPGGYIFFPWPYPSYQDGGYPPFQGGYAGASIPLNRQSSFGDNVYQPSMDGLADRVDDFIPTTNEVFRNEEFSLSDLDISPYRVENPQLARRGTGRKSQRERGKGVAAMSSQHVGRSSYRGCSHSEDQRKGKAASSRSSEFQSSSAVTDVTQSIRIQGMKVLFDMVRLWAAETNPSVKKEYAFLIREMKHNLGLPTDGDDADE